MLANPATMVSASRALGRRRASKWPTITANAGSYSTIAEASADQREHRVELADGADLGPAEDADRAENRSGGHQAAAAVTVEPPAGRYGGDRGEQDGRSRRP